MVPSKFLPKPKLTIWLWWKWYTAYLTSYHGRVSHTTQRLRKCVWETRSAPGLLQILPCCPYHYLHSTTNFWVRLNCPPVYRSIPMCLISLHSSILGSMCTIAQQRNPEAKRYNRCSKYLKSTKVKEWTIVHHKSGTIGAINTHYPPSPRHRNFLTFILLFLLNFSSASNPSFCTFICTFFFTNVSAWSQSYHMVPMLPIPPLIHWRAHVLHWSQNARLPGLRAAPLLCWRAFEQIVRLRPFSSLLLLFRFQVRPADNPLERAETRLPMLVRLEKGLLSTKGCKNIIFTTIEWKYRI